MPCISHKEALIYPALPVRGRMRRRESSTKCLIHGGRRGRVPRRGELKNATEGIFQRFHKETKYSAFSAAQGRAAKISGCKLLIL
jgi:hypothetical protein